MNLGRTSKVLSILLIALIYACSSPVVAIHADVDINHYAAMDVSRVLEKGQQSTLELSDNPLDPDEPELRTTFGSRPGAVVRGWPSTGGLYVFVATSGVELDFLGVDRFDSTPRSLDKEEEDVLCAKMRKLGASWYADEWEYVQKSLQHPNPYEPVLLFAWPEGDGVWLLKSTNSEASGLGVGRVANAVSMGERCEIVEKLGGVFYAHPKDCPDLKL